MTNTILVPKILEGKRFCTGRTEDKDLKKCLSEGYEAQFMPAVADARIAAQGDIMGGPEFTDIWMCNYCTLSVKATGKTKQGNPVVVYAHVPNYLSDPDNIEKVIDQGTINGAGRMPQEEFQRLLDLEDNENVFVVDYNALRNSCSWGFEIPLNEAIKHPQTIPFLGGEERAEKYLKKHEEVIGNSRKIVREEGKIEFKKHKEVNGNSIGIWRSDDLSDHPLARLLCLDYVVVNLGGVRQISGLNGKGYFGSGNGFLGVKN